MKRRILYILVLIITVSCVTNSSDETVPKVIPDHTPYIAGLLEFSPDTTHHYPEVVVGYFTDTQNLNDPEILYEYPGIYSPTLLRQVVQTSILFALGYQPEPEAVVSVQGPIGTSEEQKVTFIHEGNGIYGDKQYSLKRVPGGIYKLKVILPDGRTYTGETYIPETVRLSLADSISVDVKYEPYGDGTPREEDIKPYPIIFNYPDEHFLTVLQYNSDKDRELLLLQPDEGFLYTDRSSYLRTGIGYSVSLPNASSDTLPRHWIQRLDKPRDEVWMEKHWWLRFSYFSDGIGKMFFPLLDFFATDEEWLDQIHEPASNATANNDSTYLFDVSTIRKVGRSGEVLPKDSSDAIGFFSGYYSIYRQTTLYPIRNFDLDSVLTAHGND